MAAIKITQAITINANPEVIFDFTQEYKKRLDWDTFLIKAELTNGAIKADKGIKAYCVSKYGMGMTTVYITFNRPRVAAIKMTEGPYMFQSFSGSWSFKELKKDQTEVTFLYLFMLRFPFNLITFFIRRNFQNNVRQRLIDLKNCIERTEPQ